VTEITVGIRNLKAHLSQYIQLVKEGRAVVITRYGRPIARMIPTGVVEWNSKKLRDIEPVAVNRGDKLVSDIVVEMREEGLLATLAGVLPAGAGHHRRR